MKLKTRLAIAFVTFSVLPIMFVGLMLSVGRLFMVYRMDEFAPEVKTMVAQLMITAVLMLMFICGSLTIWVYRSILRPLSKLQEATRKIRDGNLDFTLDIEEDDEIGELCQDFEEMRIRLKESAEQKIQYDNENKELISNISHDLKTPITAIKGYVEGILDGVASSPEKLEKYIRTIYNKANDMDRLIDELTFYSKIDTNKIPYTFNKINVNSYFRDCAEEVGLDMESRGIELGYFNYVNEDVEVIADAEQMKRVINNIISNSVKYLDKPNGHQSTSSIKDVGRVLFHGWRLRIMAGALPPRICPISLTGSTARIPPGIRPRAEAASAFPLSRRSLKITAAASGPPAKKESARKCILC